MFNSANCLVNCNNPDKAKVIIPFALSGFVFDKFSTFYCKSVKK